MRTRVVDKWVSSHKISRWSLQRLFSSTGRETHLLGEGGKERESVELKNNTSYF